MQTALWTYVLPVLKVCIIRAEQPFHERNGIPGMVPITYPSDFYLLMPIDIAVESSTCEIDARLVIGAAMIKTSPDAPYKIHTITFSRLPNEIYP